MNWVTHLPHIQICVLHSLSRLLMNGMSVAKGAVFFIFHSLRVLLSVFRRSIISPFTLGAFQSNYISHFSNLENISIISFALAKPDFIISTSTPPL